MGRLVVLALFLVSSAYSQWKVEFSVQDFPRPSPSAAMRAWYFNRWRVLPDTTINIFVTHQFTSEIDSFPFIFAVDSIRGRGNDRQALVRLQYKVDSADAYRVYSWTESHPPEYDTLWDSDTTWHLYTPHVVDTVAYIGDSTRQDLIWMRQWWPYELAAGGYTISHGDQELRFMLYKIIGNPTVNNGFDQQCIFKFRLERTWLETEMDWVDSLDIRAYPLVDHP